jgi:hypothetical protein
MLSLESSVLTRLILARHASICRSIQLDAKGEVLTLLKSLADEGSAVITVADPNECLGRLLHENVAERRLLPRFFADLEKSIDTAWARLDQVSPSLRPAA